MASLPRPLLALLVAVVAFFAVWTLALKPSSSSSSSTAPAAPGAVHTTTHATKPSAHTSTPAHPTTAHAAKPVKAHGVAAQLATLNAAMAAHKVVALLFYNPAGADDQADRQVLSALSSRHGKVVKVEASIADVAHFEAITNHVPVTTSPTLIVIDAKHQASTLVGFADPLEFNQLISAALQVK